MTVRLARRSDAEAIAEVHVASWQSAYRGIISDQGLDSLSVPDRKQIWEQTLDIDDPMVFVAEADGRIIGFVNCWHCRDADKDPLSVGEIGGIYLAPEYWGQGFGKDLINTALNFLRQRGFRQVTLWVLENNSQACGFYEKAGFQTDGKREAAHIAGTDLIKIRYALDLN